MKVFIPVLVMSGMDVLCDLGIFVYLWQATVVVLCNKPFQIGIFANWTAVFISFETKKVAGMKTCKLFYL